MPEYASSRRTATAAVATSAVRSGRNVSSSIPAIPVTALAKGPRFSIFTAVPAPSNAVPIAMVAGSCSEYMKPGRNTNPRVGGSSASTARSASRFVDKYRGSTPGGADAAEKKSSAPTPTLAACYVTYVSARVVLYNSRMECTQTLFQFQKMKKKEDKPHTHTHTRTHAHTHTKWAAHARLPCAQRGLLTRIEVK